MSRAAHSHLGNDEPPLPRLPREFHHSSSGRGLVVIVLTASIIFLAANLGAKAFLSRNPQNLTYWLIQEKWRLLDLRQSPVDWLVLGDSSCNQGVEPATWTQLTQAEMLNLCTIGDFGLVDDAWMLAHYIRAHGAPKGVILVHAYDAWHRPWPMPSLLAEIPKAFRYWKAMTPQPPLSVVDEVRVFLYRQIPLYSQSQSLRRAALSFVFSRKRSHFDLARNGFMAESVPSPKVAKQDAQNHRKFVANNQPEISAANRMSLKAIIDLADRHKISLHVATGPIVSELAEDSSFQRYYAGLHELIEQEGNRSTHVHVIPHLVTFSADEMQNADHVIAGAAKTFTNRLASFVYAKKQ